MRRLAIAFGLAISSVPLGLTAHADALCKHSYAHCDEVAIYVCRDRHLGYREFIGGSDFGSAGDIALDKAAAAGYDVDSCRRRQ